MRGIELTPEEQAKWDAFVVRQRSDTVAKIHGSALTIAVSPSTVEDFDVQQAVELGASILLDKPIVVVVPFGRSVPDGLRRAASHVVVMSHDLDTEAGQLELNRKLGAVLSEMGIDMRPSR